MTNAPRVARHGRTSLTLSEAARVTGGRVLGDGDASFRRVAPVFDAGPRDLALLAHRRYAAHLPRCDAPALLVSESLASLSAGPANRLVVADPRRALAVLLPVLHPAPVEEWSVHASAIVDDAATVPAGVAVGANAVIGAGVVLAQDVRIGANCVIGERVVIGSGTVLFPNVTVYADSLVGERVIVHAGTRIGVDGFGYVEAAGRHRKVLQVGRCVIEDDVEIGANCTIDRGSIGETRIGEGSKLDNLVHVGHNVVIGPGSLVVAQVGIAGSTWVGEGVAIGGQAGLVEHLRIGDRAKIGAQAGVISDVAPGKIVSGYPARDHRTYLKAMARLMRLPELARRVGRMERSLARLGRGSATERRRQTAREREPVAEAADR